MDMDKKDFDKIPNSVVKIAKQLMDNGYSCYLVGGPVRDLLLGKTPKDFDLATDALPETVAEIFPKSISTSAKFGTVIVLSEDDSGEHFPVEVTTFRSEADYVDGRWPTKVEFTSDLYRDLGRRDFTINALAINLNTLDDGVDDNEIVDVFGGIDDINAKIIRAVGTPEERFSEDGLRAFRACRLASVLGFQIEEETFDAIRKTLVVSAQVSAERVRDEISKLLYGSSKPSVGFELLRTSGLLELAIPELLEGVGIKQPEEYHIHDVYRHTLAVVDAADDSVKLAALFHDIGKPRCEDDGHFYDHDRVSSEMTEEIMKRLKFSNAEIEKTVKLVRNHMFIYFDWRKESNSNWTDAAVRRLLQRVGTENIDDLFKLRIADAISNPRSKFDASEINSLENHVSKIREEDVALKVTDLKISGSDLMNIGVTPGPKVGKILNELLEVVIENPSLNKQEELISLAKDLI